MSSGQSYVTIELTKPGNWAKAGHCAGSQDPDLWYAEDKTNGHGHSADVALAIQICQGCPSRTECLIWALEVDPAHDWGVWGATTKEERKKLRKQQAA